MSGAATASRSKVRVELPKSRVVAIQQLRGVAVLLVIAVHAVAATNLRYHDTGALVRVVPNLRLFGNTGVDLFFVISGFAMAHAMTKTSSAYAFLAARWRRIWPLSIIATIAVLALPATWHRLSMSGLVSSVTILPLADGAGYHRPLLLVGWTLGFETMFYLLTAVAIARRGGARMALGLSILVALIGMLFTPGWAPLRMLINPMVGEFALGIAIWLAWYRGVAETLALGGALLAAGAIGLIPVAVATEPRLAVAGISSTARLLMWGMPWALIVFGLVAGKPATGWLATRLGWLGDASYAIYLFHLTAISMFAIVAPAALSRSLFFATASAAGLLAGIAAHHAIERPLLQRLEGLRSQRPDIP